MKLIKLLLSFSILAHLGSCKNEKLQLEASDQQSFSSLMEAIESGADLTNLKPNQPSQTLPVEVKANDRSEQPLYFTNAESFAAACPDLPTEDFEKGNLGSGQVVSMFDPLTAGTNNAYFSPGDILPGIQINTFGYNGYDLAFTNNFFGVPTKAIFANFVRDTLVIDFTQSDVTSVGMNIYSIFSSSITYVWITYGSGDIWQSTLNVPTSGLYWGAIAAPGENITKVTIFSSTNQVEGIDNVSFGTCVNDADNDGIEDDEDNCPFVANSGQENLDGDSEGDACDADDDNDGVNDGQDNCPFLANSGQENFDGDSEGDACDADDDNDGVNDDVDAHPNSNQDATVIIDGCNSGVTNAQIGSGGNMMDLIRDCAVNATNHGNFTSCVSALANAWKAAGLITGAQKGTIMSCASAANIP